MVWGISLKIVLDIFMFFSFAVEHPSSNLTEGKGGSAAKGGSKMGNEAAEQKICSVFDLNSFGGLRKVTSKSVYSVLCSVLGRRKETSAQSPVKMT